MLLELSIRNIALIEELTLEFSRGFHVFTGETGAGKSIVVDSLNMALGGRADRDLIRTGADRACVQALFDISGNPRALAFVKELGAEADDDLVAISRELRSNGRNICRVSGVIVPLSTLKQLTGMLADIHGQHEHQALIDPSKHIGFLDSFGDGNHQALLGEVAHAYAERAQAAAAYRKVTSEAAERARLIDMLEFQTGEIDALHLKRGEEDKLEKKAKFCENAEKIQDAVGEAYHLVYGGDSGAQGALEQLDSAYRALESVRKADERVNPLMERIHDAYYSVQDVGYELRSLSEGMSYDPALADRIYDRLDRIRRLERKYGDTLEQVMDFGEEAHRRLDELKRSGESSAELRETVLKLDARLKELCGELTRRRKELAERLSAQVRLHLADLGMAKTRFEVRIDPIKPNAGGCDDVEFLISANPGEPLKSMASVASGGELSRIMLALKTIAIDADGVDCMVFDEIDTGVSGRMAQAVGEKMKLIAGKHQVLCVTHLPQIAALGDIHFAVEKNTDGVRTSSCVRKLDDEGRILEISRLIGDGADSETSILHARHLLGL